MPYLRKTCGGATVHGYTWANSGDVVEVSDDIARMLLAIPDADFVEVAAPLAASTFSEVVNDTPAVNRPVQRPRSISRR